MFVLATDLDGTFLGGSRLERFELYRQIKNIENQLLIFVTGRAVESVRPILSDPIIPTPDYIIADVGATIVHGETLEPIEPIQESINSKWPGVYSVLEALPEHIIEKRQQQPQERRCSFYFKDEEDIDLTSQIAKKLGLDVLYSANKYFDILPRGVNKGSTLNSLISQLKLDPSNVLVAGDTLNDLSLFSETKFNAVAVGNSEKGLIDSIKQRKKTFFAQGVGAAGISEAIDAFKFELKVSPPKKRTNGSYDFLIVYHRQPFDEKYEGGVLKQSRPKSPNGIIPTLLSTFKNYNKAGWLAWSQSDLVDSPQKFQDSVQIEIENTQIDVLRVALSAKEISAFYKEFSKEALWPILHCFVEQANFDHSKWQDFLYVNQLFAKKIAEEAAKSALIWIHDYNLWMVPSYLKKYRPDLNVAFFHHTPFPPADVFNIIPWSHEIIGSLLQCDYIGFHIPRYVQNFVDAAGSHFEIDIKSKELCAPRFLTYGAALGEKEVVKSFFYDSREIRLGVHPVGIDVDRISGILSTKAYKASYKKLSKDLPKQKIIFSAERLDYMKGPLHKLEAFERLLVLNPELVGEVTFVNICTPPAKGMEIYDKIKLEVQTAVGRINGKFSCPGWTPINFMFRSFSFEELLAFYEFADVTFISPLRDGLNLVAKEFVAVKGLSKKEGALVLSEFAGASVELHGAILSNPYDVVETADALLQALNLSRAERKDRMQRMYDIISNFNAKKWADDFIDSARS